MNPKKANLLVFASGESDPEKGGSGFLKLVEASRDGILEAEIVAVVSNHEYGGVRTKADKNNIRFIHMPAPYRAEDYQRIFQETGAEYAALSGWIKLVRGLPPEKTFNIHPGDLPRFGGHNMWGHRVHEAVEQALKRGEITASAVCMHFVIEPKSKEDYDKGPVFFRKPVPLLAGDDSETIAKKVNKVEHQWQALITNLVVTGQINWDGVNLESLVVPPDYAHLALTE